MVGRVNPDSYTAPVKSVTVETNEVTFVVQSLLIRVVFPPLSYRTVYQAG